MFLEERIIDAIRRDPMVGRGSCSPVDEAMSDEELIAEFGRKPDGTLRSPVAALKEACAFHEAWTDRYNDIAGTAF